MKDEMKDEVKDEMKDEIKDEVKVEVKDEMKESRVFVNFVAYRISNIWRAYTYWGDVEYQRIKGTTLDCGLEVMHAYLLWNIIFIGSSSINGLFSSA